MTREQLAQSIKRDCALIESLFTRKNQSYGANDDAFYNFTKGAELLFDEATYDTKFRTLMAYLTKHIVTLAKSDAILNDPEFEERCLDVAVYMLIARAMKKEIIKIESEEPKHE
ncbi:MAG: hypothetical protein H6Q73_888 [Firmicutes bacterium]|nr:hypothetical protein [Bacillota bacterium]